MLLLMTPSQISIFRWKYLLSMVICMLICLAVSPWIMSLIWLMYSCMNIRNIRLIWRRHVCIRYIIPRHPTTLTSSVNSLLCSPLDSFLWP